MRPMYVEEGKIYPVPSVTMPDRGRHGAGIRGRPRKDGALPIQKKGVAEMEAKRRAEVKAKRLAAKAEALREEEEG